MDKRTCEKGKEMDRIQRSQGRTPRKDALGIEVRDLVGFIFLIYSEDRANRICR